MFVAGIDGCRGGWVSFNVAVATMSTLVELIDLPPILRRRPKGLVALALDIPIGLLDCPRACDRASRVRLGWPRRSSVFPAPCRAALSAKSYAAASATNRRITGRGLSQQAWGIAPKIKQVDDAIKRKSQKWVFEVHPEVCFWALAGERPMTHRKKTDAGVNERFALLRSVFPDIERHLRSRPPGVSKDDLLDAAAAAWTALRICKGKARRVSEPERDANGLEAMIWF